MTSGKLITKLIIYGHPRSRSTLICSHINGFPNETFALGKVTENLELDWSQNFDTRESLYTGRAGLYLEKIRNNPPNIFKLFGNHLHNWPEAFNFIKNLNYTAIRIYRKNRFDAIISGLIGVKRGQTSARQIEVPPFDVTLQQFVQAFNIIVVQDLYWEKKFQYDCTLEYNDVPMAIQDGHLEKYGVEKNQLYKIENQESLKAAKTLIKNLQELNKWNELLHKDNLPIGDR